MKPALSRHIAALEDELNAKLIDRSRNSFALIGQGEEALHSFQKSLQEYEVPWILEETGGVYLSPMVNPFAYGDKVVSR